MTRAPDILESSGADGWGGRQTGDRPVGPADSPPSDAGRHTSGSSAGGYLSNTPPSNRHLETGGEDWLELSLRVEWGEKWPDLELKLDTAKEMAGTDNAPVELMAITDDRDRVYMVAAHGAKAGGPKGPQYRWRIESEGLTFSIMRRQLVHETLPNVLVRAGSLILMLQGLEYIWASIQDRIKALGGTIIEDKISRIDPAVDIAGVSIETLARRFERGWWVGRARSVDRRYESEHDTSRRSTGFNVGTDQVRLRAYDKLLEVRDDPQKRIALMLKRWGGIPESALRVEFQLRREILRELGAGSVNEWLAKRGAIVAYLCEEWFRMTSCKPDRKNGNTSRANASQIWQRVEKAFQAWAGAQAPGTRTPLPPQVVGDAVLLQALGCFVRHAAEAGMTFEHDDEVMTYALDCLARILKDRDATQMIAVKRMVLAAKGLLLPESEAQRGP